MMLEYEWGNPAASAAAMLLFGEHTDQLDTIQNDRQPEQVLFDHYGHGLDMDYFQQPQQPMFRSTSAMSCNQRYGLALSPAPASARIGLNLGGRTYFSSAAAIEEDMMVGRVCRRRRRMARCQAEGCGADLTHGKNYHRRHKVCEFHSKTAIVIVAGLSQRFCQQCSRFHVLSEFDQGKRSCRKRLADHNRRRRKSHDLSTSSTAINNSHDANNNSTTTDTNSTTPKKPLIAVNKPETCSSVTHALSPPQALTDIPAPFMDLGLGCGVGTSPSQSIFFTDVLSSVTDFHIRH